MTRKNIYTRAQIVARDIYGIIEGDAVAERLCADLYGFGRFDVVMDGAAEPSRFDAEEFEALLMRIAEGEPIQYIIGWTEFYGRRFAVRPGVLIPRPETEELVALIVRENDLSNPHIIDLGTGSGAIAVSLACEIEGSVVEALDLSPIAVAVASENALFHNAPMRVLEGDIFRWEPASESYDIVVSNPPYIPTSERQQMERNVTDYEPSEALFVPDSTPLVYYERIADCAMVGLRRGGKLYFEIHERLASETASMLRSKGFQDVEIHQDMNSKPRMVVCRKR